MGRTRIAISGMTCEHCAIAVQRALEGAGVHGAAVDYRRGFAEFESEGVELDRLRDGVRAAGYEAGELESITGDGQPGAAPARPGARDGDGDYDLAIVGSGAGAFAAAIQAADRGARTIMVEHGTVGGTCVNIGCVPSKAMLRAGEVYWLAGHSPHEGAPTHTGAVELERLVRQKDALVEELRQRKYCDLIESYGWELLKGHAEFADEGTLVVDGEEITASHYLVATGAGPAIPPIDGLEETGYITSTSGLELKRLPKRLLVVGANYIGLEMGQLYAHLGSEIVLLDMAERISPLEEPEVAKTMSDILGSEGIEIVTEAQVARASQDDGRKSLHALVDGEERTFRGDEILIAAGRRPRTDRIGADRAGIQLGERGAIEIDPTMRTTNPRVFAAGDCTPAPQFVYVAAAQGAAAARNALDGAAETIDYRALPRVTFTHPQIAAAGLTDEQARDEGLDCRCHTLPLDAVPRADVNLDRRGFVKIVAERDSGRIVGATAVAENAGDVILAAVYAIQFGLTIDDVARAWAPYLTMSEGFKLAAQTFERDVSKLSCCAA